MCLVAWYSLYFIARCFAFAHLSPVGCSPGQRADCKTHTSLRCLDAINMLYPFINWIYVAVDLKNKYVTVHIYRITSVQNQVGEDLCVFRYKPVTTLAWTIKPGDWHLPVLNLKVLALSTQHMVSERHDVMERVGCGAGTCGIPCLPLVLPLFCPVNFFSPNFLYLFSAAANWEKWILLPLKALGIFLLVFSIKEHALF